MQPGYEQGGVYVHVATCMASLSVPFEFGPLVMW